MCTLLFCTLHTGKGGAVPHGALFGSTTLGTLWGGPSFMYLAQSLYSRYRPSPSTLATLVAPTQMVWFMSAAFQPCSHMVLCVARRSSSAHISCNGLLRAALGRTPFKGSLLCFILCSKSLAELADGNVTTYVAPKARNGGDPIPSLQSHAATSRLGACVQRRTCLWLRSASSGLMRSHRVENFLLSDWVSSRWSSSSVSTPVKRSTHRLSACALVDSADLIWEVTESRRDKTRARSAWVTALVVSTGVTGAGGPTGAGGALGRSGAPPPGESIMTVEEFGIGGGEPGADK